jgi:hypothetical protein
MARRFRPAAQRCFEHQAAGKARLIEQHGAECGVARLRELLIEDCPKFRNWHDPCRAYYVGLKEWWATQAANKRKLARLNRN